MSNWDLAVPVDADITPFPQPTAPPASKPRVSKLPTARAGLGSRSGIPAPSSPSTLTNVASRNKVNGRPLESPSGASPARKPATITASVGSKTYTANTTSQNTVRRQPLTQQSSIRTGRVVNSGYGNSVNGNKFRESKTARDTARATPTEPLQQENNGTSSSNTHQKDEDASLDVQEEPWAARTSDEWPRPSLSDRTMQSLAQIPPSPATGRRRSSFFNPQSPIATKSRAAVGGEEDASKVPPRSTGLNGTVRVRPSGVSRNGTKSPVRSPLRPSERQPPTATRTVPAATGPEPRTTARQAESQATTPSRPSRPHPSATTLQKPTPERSPVPKSSLALRQQISQQRAAHKARTQDSKNGPSSMTYDFEECDDPFNLKPKDGKDELRRQIESARRDGRLNISALGLASIPDEVLQMYDTESMADSTVSWSETVDLKRLVAADNEINQIGDDVFPDMSAEALAYDMAADARGNQFGGLEMLDLHSNRLARVPTGLRRLQFLSTVNLSRNSLDMSVFDILSQVSSLRKLLLANNALEGSVPESLGRLANLEVLDIEGNKVSALPESSVQHLANLQVLKVSSNKLSSLPTDVLSSLPHLLEISASQNKLSGTLFLSDSVSGGFESLQALDVSSNALLHLLEPDDGSWSLPSLTRLDVSRNRLSAIPSLSGCMHLVTLLAGENQLECMPSGLAALKRTLRTIALPVNNIRVVDDVVVSMEALEVLDLSNNPLREKRFLTMDAHAIKLDLAKRVDVAKVMSGST